MDEIIRLVLRRNKERRLLNKNDMQRICEIIKGLNNLDYDIDFKIKCEDNSDAAGCCYSDNIEFYKEGMEKYIEEHYDVFNSKFDYDGSKVDVHNFFILSIIFHEISLNSIKSSSFSISSPAFSHFFCNSSIKFPKVHKLNFLNLSLNLSIILL